MCGAVRLVPDPLSATDSFQPMASTMASAKSCPRAMLAKGLRLATPGGLRPICYVCVECSKLNVRNRT